MIQTLSEDSSQDGAKWKRKRVCMDNGFQLPPRLSPCTGFKERLYVHLLIQAMMGIVGPQWTNDRVTVFHLMQPHSINARL